MYLEQEQQEHKPLSKNTNPKIKKKKKNYRSKQIATKYKLDPEKSTL